MWTFKSVVVGAMVAVLSWSVLIGPSSVAWAKGTSTNTKGHVVVQVLGDSSALTLAIAIAAPKLESKYGYTVRDGGILGCGVVNGPLVRVRGVVKTTAQACNGTAPPPGTPADEQPWQLQWQQDLAAHHPNVVVVLAGRWEVVDRTYNGQWTNILDPTFAAYVKQQLELASNVVAASGAKLVFMTSPCTQEAPQPNGAPWPENDSARLAAYNQLVQQVAAENPGSDSVIDLNSVVCPGGKFSFAYKGVTIRQPDGVHFTITAGPVLERSLMTGVLAAGRADLERHGSAKH